MIGTGFGGFLVHPLMERECEKIEGTPTKAQAEAIMERALKVLHYRDKSTYNKWSLGTAEKVVFMIELYHFSNFHFSDHIFEVIFSGLHFCDHIFEVIFSDHLGIIFLGAYFRGHIFGIMFLGSYFPDHIFGSIFSRCIFGIIFLGSYF